MLVLYQCCMCYILLCAQAYLFCICSYSCPKIMKFIQYPTLCISSSLKNFHVQNLCLWICCCSVYVPKTKINTFGCQKLLINFCGIPGQCIVLLVNFCGYIISAS